MKISELGFKSTVLLLLTSWKEAGKGAIIWLSSEMLYVIILVDFLHQLELLSGKILRGIWCCLYVRTIPYGVELPPITLLLYLGDGILFLHDI